jgi:microcystin-dependent protein
MTTTTKNTFTTGMGATHKGMILFDSTLNQLQVWDGAAWRRYTYTGTAPVNVNPATNTVALNPGTGVGDLLSWNGANWVNISTNTYVKTNAINVQPSLTMNYCMALQGVFPSQNGNSPFLGEVVLYAFSFAPRGWAQCNGQLLPIAQNQALFALLGTQYGGNGSTTFALPDLRGRAAVHKGQGTGLTIRTIGERDGTEAVPAN